MEGGTSLWWSSLGRNKKCITANLRSPEGRRLVRQLADASDVLVENFRPGSMERWGLGPDELKQTNPKLVYTRVSGYGQNGPYAPRPGYASVCEGVGGFRYVNGFPDQAPVRPNLSLGDSLAGLHAALGIVLALVQRDRHTGQGQVVDVAIYEAVFNMMEAVVPEYDRLGVVREPAGAALSGIVPTNTYPTRDGQYVIIGGNGDSIFKRLMHAAGRADMAEDPRLATNQGRVEHVAEVDGAIEAWTRTLTAREVHARLEQAEVPCGLIYSVKDIAADPHYEARGMFEAVDVGGRPLRIPAIVPKLTGSPGGTNWPGPPVGAHNREVYGGLLGLSDAELASLAAAGAI
jgi:crotonobetainyl-CoA:carnitine CoA-transferase CaiB-like acyl-CoA transferase